ncbi:MAG: outer membrane protein assembly factor BamA [Opitutales bacterium]
MKITPDTPRSRWQSLLLAALLTGWMGLAAPVWAQMAAPPADGGGEATGAAAAPGESGVTTEPIVQEISIQIIGPQQINREAILAHLSLRQGMPYSQTLVDQSIRSLYETGFYDYIQGTREPVANGVRLVLSILPKYRVSAVIYQGNKEYSKSELSEQVKTVAGGVLDEVQVKRDSDKLFQFYQKRGYSRVKITYTIDKNDNTGTGVVTFNIDEGPDVTISAVKFVGNAHISSGTLQDQIETTDYTWLISWITGSGRYQQDVFQDDLDKLRDYYKNRGFLDVDIPDSEVEFLYPHRDALRIVIHIHEGRQYHIGTIGVSGNTIFQSAQLEKLLTIKSGDIFAPAEVDKNADALKDFYGQHGYLDTFVRADRRPNLDTGNIDLNFIIAESDKYFVEGINIQGNTKTRSSVIVRELALAPGDVFDTVRMKTSETRLKNTRFFDEVNLAPETTNIPGRRNLRITVKEGRTGNLTFGAGFSTVESVVAYVELTQSNFDLFNYRNYFQGGGQKARIRISIGTESSELLLSFEEPWLWERELAAGIEVFRTQTGYLSTTFNEITTGFDVYLRKRLFELVEGRLSYTLEDVQIENVQLGAPPQVFAEQGHTSLSQVGFTLLRDTRNDEVFPTDGSRYELINSLAGGPFGGQTDFYQIEARAGWWWPTFSVGNQVMSLVGRVGTSLGIDGKSVPYAQRYFLGGPYNLRGYSFRNVGPKDTQFATPAYGQPIGGESFAYFSPEYSIEVINPVRFAAFYDFGYVNSGAFQFSPSGYRDDVGVGIRVLILGAPMRLDLGYPLNPDQFQSHSVQFNFSFGTVF